MEYEMSDDRLDRMEVKIDKLVEAVLTMTHLHGSIERVEGRVDKLEEDVHEIEKKMPLVDALLSMIGKVGGGLLLLLVGGAVGSYFVF